MTAKDELGLQSLEYFGGHGALDIEICPWMAGGVFFLAAVTLQLLNAMDLAPGVHYQLRQGWDSELVGELVRMVVLYSLVPWDVLDVEIGDFHLETSDVMVVFELELVLPDLEATWGC